MGSNVFHWLFETRQRILRMSVCWGRPEVVGAGQIDANDPKQKLRQAEVPFFDGPQQ
jgi:hypothetical protein